MVRLYGTKSFGGSWDEATIQAVWNKADVVPGYDARLYRKDRCGHWIARKDYGQTTKWGWEIDHVLPVARGGRDDLSNLQPLYWESNRAKGDTYPWNCAG